MKGSLQFGRRAQPTPSGYLSLREKAKITRATAAAPRFCTRVARRPVFEIAGASRPLEILSALVFERQRDARTKGCHLSILNLHVHLGDFGHPQIAQRRGGCLYRPSAGVLPGLFADADNVDDPIDAFPILACHLVDPFEACPNGRSILVRQSASFRAALARSPA